MTVKFNLQMRILLMVIGGALLGSGAVAALSTDNEIGSAALVIVGALVTVFAAAGGIPPLKVAGVELGAVVQAAEFFAEARTDAVLDVVEAAVDEGADGQRAVEAGRDAASNKLMTAKEWADLEDLLRVSTTGDWLSTKSRPSRLERAEIQRRAMRALQEIRDENAKKPPPSGEDGGSHEG